MFPVVDRARAEAPADDRELTLTGPALRVRIPRPSDAAALFEAAADAEVTRWFSWGPYKHEREAFEYLARLPAARASGERLELVVEHLERGPIGISGLSELSRRDRRAVIGTWLGREWWGSGTNAESKALMCHLAFAVLRLERLGSYTDVDHTRSQRALERFGFEREGVLRRFHRHGERSLDVAVYSLLRSEWKASSLRDVPVEVAGEPPPAFVVVG